MSPLVHEAAAAWWTFVVPASVQALVVLAIVWAVDALLPRRTWPELRAALWSAALLKFVLPPSVSSPVSLARALPPSLAAAFEPAPGEATISLALAAAGTWAAVALALFAAGAARYVVLRRAWIAGATPAPASPVRDAARTARLPRAPRVLLSPAAAVPCVAGLFRPVVFLPAGLPSALTPEELRHVLLHEFTHLRRRDTWRAALVATLQVLFWFHPLAFVARRRLQALREECCDRAVARLLGDDTGAYRRTLARVVLFSIGEPLPGAAAFGRHGSAVLARLRALEEARRDRTILRRVATATALLVVAVGVLPMAGGLERSAQQIADLVMQAPGCLQRQHYILYRLATEPAESNP